MRRRAALAVLTGCVLAVALGALALRVGSPLFWERYLRAQLGAATALPAWYEPRELVAGGNEAPAPRVAPELEALDGRALETAAAYAAAHDSLSLIVERNDHIVFERYWQGSRFDTLTDARAFARLLPALLTGGAIAHRKIAWADEPLRYLLREWKSDARGAITVRSLLQMSSGLMPPAASRAPWSAESQQLFGTDVTAAVLAEPLVADSGHSWLVQRADPQLMSLVLERATGERYAAYLSQELWRRIGAADAWLYLDRPGGSAHADCCMLAQQGDWIRVAELLLGDGNYRGYEIIRPGWVKAMRAPAAANSDYGTALRLSARAGGGQAPYVAGDTYAVDGGDGNFLWLVPSLHLAVLRTAYRGHPDFDESRIPNLIVSGARDFVPATARPGSDLSRIVPGH
ncbi:MAG TPA: serine hydrolase [Steroidobacteraceae bacterium]|nr:serine hydrolase [Steroidobacteraceae bacterium]